MYHLQEGRTMERITNPATRMLIRHHAICKVCGRLTLRELLPRKEEMCDKGVALLLKSLREFKAQLPN
jgi:hypothetical protein